jgi:hypothetical protein
LRSTALQPKQDQLGVALDVERLHDSLLFARIFFWRAEWRFYRGFLEKWVFSGGVLVVFSWWIVVSLWFLEAHFSASKKMPTLRTIFLHSNWRRFFSAEMAGYCTA